MVQNLTVFVDRLAVVKTRTMKISIAYYGLTVGVAYQSIGTKFKIMKFSSKALGGNSAKQKFPVIQ